VAGPVILAWEWLASPNGVQRPADEQQAIDQHTSSLVLYQFRMCPFCVKVRWTIKRLSLDIETFDVLRDAPAREQLLAGGGEIKVPCLKITNHQGNETWMYESTDIVHYLQERFA
ncbi:MAG: glutathione S-transferase N-terminal domain-containing protein, partial [Gammaproteobacteria bacterium]|nr:glutathione S-transferase N-terminal domain-containing protein [Gammaproteobacteria bacterium]